MSILQKVISWKARCPMSTNVKKERNYRAKMVSTTVESIEFRQRVDEAFALIQSVSSELIEGSYQPNVWDLAYYYAMIASADELEKEVRSQFNGTAHTD